MSDGEDDRQTPPAPTESADEELVENRRPRLLPVWILLGAAALAGGAWAVTEHLDGGPPPNDAEVPLITASTDPWKVRPDDPGGMEIPNRGTLIYETLTTADPEEAPERVLPSPEEPLSPPQPEAEEPAAPDEASATAAASLESVGIEETQPGADEERPAPEAEAPKPFTVMETPLPEPEAPEPASVEEVFPTESGAPEPASVVEALPTEPGPAELALAEDAFPTEPEALEPALVDEAFPTEPETPGLAPVVLPPPPKPQARSDPAPPEDAAPVPLPVNKPARAERLERPRESAAPAQRESAPSTAGGWYYIQLGTARARGPLEQHWETLRREHNDTLIGLSPLVMPVDRGDNGIMYRLRAGPLSDEDAARWVCAQLGARGLECFVPRD